MSDMKALGIISVAAGVLLMLISAFALSFASMIVLFELPFYNEIALIDYAAWFGLLSSGFVFTILGSSIQNNDS